MNKFKKQLKELDNQINSLREQKKAAIIKKVENCKHPKRSVVELPYQSSTTFTHADPNWLLCEDCGYTEEGWGCGFDKLAHVSDDRAGKITRDEWLELRTYCVWQNRDEPLICN